MTIAKKKIGADRLARGRVRTQSGSAVPGRWVDFLDRNQSTGDEEMAIGPALLTGALAGIAFVGCNMMRARPAHAAQAAQPGRRREVVVNGKRVKTVDVHA